MDQGRCLVELASLLERSLNAPTPGLRIQFPYHLIDDLLRPGLPIDSCSLSRTISIVEENKDRLHQVLHTESLRFLSCVLLGSSAPSDQAHGLHLLLGDTVVREILLPTEHSLFIQRKLTAGLCSVFHDEARDLGLRKLAGKLLLEALLEFKSAGTADFKALGLGCLDRRVVSLFCRHPEIVLRFFAGGILRFLHYNSCNALWTADDAEYRSIFVRYLTEFPDNWPRCFHLYSREISRQRNTEDSCYSIVHLYFTADKKTYTNSFMHATVTSDLLTFIIPHIEASRESFHLVEVPLRHISPSATHGVDRLENKRFQLRLHLDKTGIIFKNGGGQQSQCSIVCLFSDEDLTGLWTKIKEVGNQTQAQNGERAVGRRPSSILISLDTGDEVAEKSDKYLDKASDVEGSMTDSSLLGPIAHQTRTSHGPGNSLTVHEAAADSPVADRKPPAVDKNDPGNGATSEGVYQLPNGKVTTSTDNTSLSQLPVLTQRDLASREDAGNSSSLVRDAIDPPENRSIAPKSSDLKPIGLGKSPSKPNTTGLEKPPEDHTSRSSTSGKDKARPPNTQESLLFPCTRRAKRTLYTSSAAVDWDEDLRPSDDEAEAEKDKDFTSVSSPFPSESSAFGRVVGTAKKKRKSGSARKGGKRKQRPKRSKAKTGKGKKNHKLPLYPRGSSAFNDDQTTKPVHQNRDEGRENISGNPSKGDANHKVNEIEELQHTPRSLLSTHDSVSPCKSSGLFIDVQPGDGKFNALRSLGLYSNVSVCSDRVWGSSAIGSIGSGSNRGEDCRQDHVGRTTNIKPKLGAEKEQGRGNRLGQKLAAALFESGDFPGDSSLLTDERSNSYSPSSGRKNDDDLQLNPRPAQEPIPKPELQNRPKRDQQAELKPGMGGLISDSAERTQDYPSGEPIEMNIQASADDISAQGNALRASRKRTANDQSELPQKKHQIDTFESEGPSSEEPRLPLQPERPTTQLDVNLQLDADETSSWITTEGDGTSDRDTRLELPDKWGSEDTSSDDLTPTPTGYLMPFPKAIVDANGSPCLRSERFLDCQQSIGNNTPGWRLQKQLQAEQHGVDRQPSGEPDSEATECYPLNVPTFRDRVRRHLGQDLVGPKVQNASSDSESGTSVDDEQALSFAKALGGSPVDAGIARDGTEPASAVDTDKLEREHEESSGHASLGSSIDYSVHLESDLDLHDLRPLTDRDMTAWQTSLQAIQGTTDNILLSTNKDIMRHVQREREAINRVLEQYMQGCHRVLDQLFQAQEERIAAYRQQLSSIQEHQAGLCRGLMRRLEGEQ